MSEKDKRFLAYWQEKQHGILFGAIVLLLVNGITYLSGNPLGSREALLLNLALLIIGGICYEGGYTWWINSRRYKRLTQN